MEPFWDPPSRPSGPRTEVPPEPPLIGPVNLYSDRNDIHRMNSFNVYGYRLKSTDIVAMKDILTDFKDIRHQTDLSNTWWFKAYHILFACFNLSPVLALIQCILSSSVTIALKSCLKKTGLRRVTLKRKSGDGKHNHKVTKL
jgi:hypothetical protein